MIPNVFISSTISDLHYLREALKDSVEELGYNPVLSEFGDIGFLPQTTAENSCYLAMRDCQIAVLIVGKRYGSISSNDLSVTHNEFQTARINKIPVICLVDKEVLSFKKVYDEEPTNISSIKFPAMDYPEKTFKLIQKINNLQSNNAILPFTSVADGRRLLKTQIAHIFGDLLRSKYDPVKTEVKDILSEVITLRQEIRDKKMDPQPFLRATRFLLDDINSSLRHCFEGINGSVEKAVPLLIKFSTFDKYLEENNIEVIIEESNIRQLIKDNFINHEKRLMPITGGLRVTNSIEQKISEWAITKDKKIILNSFAKNSLSYMYDYIKKSAEKVEKL